MQPRGFHERIPCLPMHAAGTYTASLVIGKHGNKTNPCLYCRSL